MIKYVLGFLFDQTFETVVLIKKKRAPDNAKEMLSKYNGVGGKVEGNETFNQAMEREFREETGVKIPLACWKQVIDMKGNNWSCRVFASMADYEEVVSKVTTTTDEEVSLVNIEDVSIMYDVMSNLKFLVPLSISVLKEELTVEGALKY